LADRFGERVLFVVQAPAIAIIQLDQMSQRPARAKQLAFGILALNVGGQGLGHDRKAWLKLVKINSKANSGATARRLAAHS
jgi:hypothetical protein